MSDLNKLLDKWDQEIQREFSPDPQTLIRLGDQILLADRIITALQAQCAAQRQALEAIRKEIICENCSEYTVRAGDAREEPSAFCELNPKKYQIGCGSCEEWHADSNAGVLAHQALSTDTGTDLLKRVRELEQAEARVAELTAALDIAHEAIVILQEEAGEKIMYSQDFIEKLDAFEREFKVGE